MNKLRDFIRVHAEVRRIAATVRAGQPVIANLGVKAPLQIFNATGVTFYRINSDPKNLIELNVKGLTKMEEQA